MSMSEGAFLFPTFERLLQKLDYRLNSLDLHEEVHTALQKWESFLPRICAVLDDAENKQMTNSSVKAWLDDLNDLPYDMEDILDRFKVDAQMSTMTERPNQACTMIQRPYQASTSKFTLKCFSCFRQNNNFVDSDTVSKVKVIAMRLQGMVEKSEILGLLSSKIQHRQTPEIATARRISPTTSLPELYVYGRENEKAAILQKLLNDEGNSKHEGYCVLPIVGMAGIGKTTLARLVYNEVGPETFQLKAWVCVSEESDVLTIARSILEALNQGMPYLNNLDFLQEKLKEKLFDKKFLLVLDDVWKEDYTLRDVLQALFKSGAPGSKIIITTRNMQVAEVIGGKDAVCHLEALKDDECLSILAEFALGAKNFDAHPSLKEVGEEIVKNCRGLPLVVKIVGGVVHGKQDLEDWKRLLDEMWDLKCDKSNILYTLNLGCHYLPCHLKQCFAYLAMFPKDHQFSKEEIIFLWMAEELLQPQPEGENQMEDIVINIFVTCNQDH